MDINKIKKIVINLLRRPDRLESFEKEMNFIGWDYDVFAGIDKGGYVGCALSHQEIMKEFLKSDDEYIMILEDDCFFMPYAKNQLEKSIKELNNLDWDFFHLGPSINCPVNNFSENLLDLSKLPKQESHHRGIYNTVCYIANKKFAEKVIDWGVENQKAIDQFFYEDIYNQLNCFGPSIPIVTQKNGFSDINGTNDNNHYLITYNWNLYTENKLNPQYFEIDYCEREKKYPEIFFIKNNKTITFELPKLEKKVNHKVKFITAIYSNLNGTELGGRPNRHSHYRWSLLSLLKITDADFVCYTSNEEFEELKKFFYDENNIDKRKLQIIKFDLKTNEFYNLINKYKDVESIKKGDRCIEIQYMKFIWFDYEDKSYDYYYWIDAGLSHCGIIPNKYLSLTGPHNRGFYESSLFNNNFLKNLIEKTGDKFLIIGKENQRNFWSGTVDPKHFFNYDRSIHIIGGMFGGRSELWEKIVELFRGYVFKVIEEDKRLYHEEDIMTLMFRNHPELFFNFYFETWWHENERINGVDMLEHVKNNKSFYKILEELNE